MDGETLVGGVRRKGRSKEVSLSPRGSTQSIKELVNEEEKANNTGLAEHMEHQERRNWAPAGDKRVNEEDESFLLSRKDDDREEEQRKSDVEELLSELSSRAVREVEQDESMSVHEVKRTSVLTKHDDKFSRDSVISIQAERYPKPSVPALSEDDIPWNLYKERLTQEEEQKELEGDDEMEEEDESEDGDYVPPTNEDLPDLYEVMDSLETDDIHLNLKTSPPPLFENEEQEHMHKRVNELKQGLAEEEIQMYLDEFEQKVEEEILMIGTVSLEDVQMEERRLREEHISFQQQQAKVQRQRQQEIMQAMERAKKYVMSKYKEKYREIRMREEHMMQKDRTYKDQIHRAFRRSESQLKKALKRRKAEVRTMYGDLTFADGQYGGSKGRRWKVDWNRTPQPVQIKLKCLRGVKDKLPGSRYVLMVSLYDRLGGHVMKWSNLKGQQWGGATLPLSHDGEFYNIELKIEQSVFTVCPSKPDMRPGMVLVFELFILRGSVTPTDKVVGWACFPVCDAEFNVIEGKYKSPMLRGDMDPGVDKFEVVEKLMAHDLENWLCNVYFEIVKLPRYMAGQKEYEVELQFTSGLLSSPVRTNTGEENIDGEKAIFGSHSDIGSLRNSRASIRSGVSAMNGESSMGSAGKVDSTATSVDGKDSTKDDPGPSSLIVDTPQGSPAAGRKSSLKFDSTIQLQKAENLTVDLRQRRGSRSNSLQVEDTFLRPLTSVGGSRKLVEEKGLKLSDDSDDSSGSDYDQNEIYALKREDAYKPVKGQPGMFYKIHHNNPADVYARKMFTLMPKTPLLSMKQRKKKVTHLEELDTHSFEVRTPWSNKGGLEHAGTKKVQYMSRMLLTELGISQIRGREFWAMILMILITYWMRMYLHYIGQWVLLVGLRIPVNKFQFLPYTVNLNYQSVLLRSRDEIALIVLGPFTNILLFVMMVLLSAFIQALFDRFPNIFSRFIMAFGIHCILDPIWILITDAAIKRYDGTQGGDHPIGDAFKLYWHFDRFYNNDNVTLFVSIAMTTFLYFVTMFTAATILYMYFLRIHNNGRLMDIYWRLHGKEDAFFLPYDLECSNEELNYICRKAEQWRGEEGERRKIAVYDYIWEEEEMVDDNWDSNAVASGNRTGLKETTTHVSIHTLHLDGLRELYRHFLKLPDGGIVEVFGEMNIPGMDEGVKQALIQRTQFQSMDSIRKRSSVRRRRSDASGLSGDSRKGSSFLDIPPDHQGIKGMAFAGSSAV